MSKFDEVLKSKTISSKLPSAPSAHPQKSSAVTTPPVSLSHSGTVLSAPLLASIDPHPSGSAPAPRKWPELPQLAQHQRLDLKRIRDPLEKLYLPFVLLPTLIIVVILTVVAIQNLRIFLQITAIFLVLGLFLWISWKLLFVSILGNSIKISSSQYSQIFRLVNEASELLGIEPPTIFIMQGHGLFEVFVAKCFSRRGFVILTSNLVDDLTERGSSRELMFYIGRQLGLLACGYFRFWLFKHLLGQFAFLFHPAWERRCHLTADRLGLLVAGDLYAAEQALITITAGCSVAPNTNMIAIREQRTELFEDVWAWLHLAFSNYPYMVDRIARLREFALQAAREGVQANAPIAVGSLPITHARIRALPLMVIHGHDGKARLELENFLFRRFPHVSPIAMVVEMASAASLPEKFEELAGEVHGAVALLTPDDLAAATRDGKISPRARQNVIMEIGWMWGRLGRRRCLMLMQGDVEMPSDLSGVEVHRYRDSPVECSEMLRDFIEALQAR
jgi:predicted nucleotide-binding protein/Zn-dependent protease with chaperone function